MKITINGMSFDLVASTEEAADLIKTLSNKKEYTATASNTNVAPAKMKRVYNTKKRKGTNGKKYNKTQNKWTPEENAYLITNFSLGQKMLSNSDFLRQRHTKSGIVSRIYAIGRGDTKGVPVEVINAFKASN